MPLGELARPGADPLREVPEYFYRTIDQVRELTGGVYGSHFLYQVLGGADEGTNVALLTGSMNTAQRRDAMLRIASGEAKVVVGLERNLVVEDAHVADLLLLQRGQRWFALSPEQVDIIQQEIDDRYEKLLALAGSAQ